MKIGIDIDGVLTDIEKYICDYGTKFCYENNIPINIEHIYYDERKLFGWDKEQDTKFWNDYLENYVKNSKPRDCAVEVINKLKEHNKIYYDKLVFKPDSEKLDYCLENGIDVMIEDSPNNVKNISSKMKVMCYNCMYNADIEGENIIRVYGWYDILEKMSMKLPK